jgi:hypothetical protein
MVPNQSSNHARNQRELCIWTTIVNGICTGICCSHVIIFVFYCLVRAGQVIIECTDWLNWFTHLLQIGWSIPVLCNHADTLEIYVWDVSVKFHVWHQHKEVLTTFLLLYWHRAFVLIEWSVNPQCLHWFSVGGSTITLASMVTAIPDSKVFPLSCRTLLVELFQIVHYVLQGFDSVSSWFFHLHSLFLAVDWKRFLVGSTLSSQIILTCIYQHLVCCLVTVTTR